MGAPLRLSLVAFEYGAGPGVGVDPVLGSTSLRDLVVRFESRRGWEPAGGYGPLALNASEVPVRFLRSGRASLLGCTCGDEGCWPLEAAVDVGPARVTWSDFAQPHRPERTYDGFGPFVFPRAPYEAAVRDVVERLGTPAA